MKEAKQNPLFKAYKREADERIRLAIEIYRARVFLGISQQELAKITNTTQKMISNIEYASVDIRFSTLNKIRKALNFKSEHWSRIYS